jgi:pimeloyl-ACP methyl ester carboxylesterase
MSARDWSAAVRIAARDVAAHTATSQPFYIGGYSTGGTLALQYTLDALDDDSLRRPDRVLLLSPAIELTPVAALASVIDLFSIVPVPVLEKVRWQEIVAEYDPYKFNSFPVNASRQVNRATRALGAALARAGSAGRLAHMPPVITWQSVVDSTVGAPGVVDALYGRLQGPSHRLVMFDVNRQQTFQSVQRPAARALIERLQGGRLATTLDIVTATDPQSANMSLPGRPKGEYRSAQHEGNLISVLRLAPDGTQTVRDTALAWPPSLVSLGHVALPFPPDDAIYGFLPGSGHAGLPSLGSLLLRGESGALSVSLGSLTRLRSNPFWPLIDEDLGTLVAADLAALPR